MNRETKQREAVLRLVRSMTSHPTADCVYELARLEIPNISKGTVYRNLKLLQEMGRISILDMRNTVSRYDARVENHYHFRCENCGEILDVDEPVDEGLNQRVARKTGLNISGHQLEFYGLCPDCAAKDKKQA